MKIHNGFISNSSSEVFVCNTDKTLEQIEEELSELLGIFNRMMGMNYSFESRFEHPYIGGEDDVTRMGHYLHISVSPKDKVIIYSASNNTIPYELFGLIERAYDAVRIHLG